MARLRTVVAFVGDGRRATQAGNLTTADAVELLALVARGEAVPDEVRSIDDIPAVAEGWRKSYVEHLDESVSSLLIALVRADGEFSIEALTSTFWEEVAEKYDYDPGDGRERARVGRLVGAMAHQLVDVGITVGGQADNLVLTELGQTIAGLLAMSATDDDEGEDDELVDIDAESLLLGCAEEEDADASRYLQAWCDAHPR